MPKRPHLPLLLLLIGSLSVWAACSRGGTDGRTEDEESARLARGNEVSIERVRAAARALAEPGATVDYVAAEMEGVVKARTKSQALLYYDGYRATLITPASDQVTQINFDLIEAKPNVGQLTAVFGTPEATPKGVLYRFETQATGATILILAEPVSMPADEGSLVRRIVIEGARVR